MSAVHYLNPMEIIPVLNCPTEACLKEKLGKLAGFYPPEKLVHLDIADGIFTDHQTSNDPEFWKQGSYGVSLEIHLMVADPVSFLDSWVTASVKRIIVPVESVTRETVVSMNAILAPRGIALMLSANPETTIEQLLSYVDLVSQFQILAVHPGPAGQMMLPEIPRKVSALRSAAPDAIIEVDGGIHEETAKVLRNAGANALACGTYLWKSDDIARTYEELMHA
jgi:ribulose-phosphate 3-epimerase